MYFVVAIFSSQFKKNIVVIRQVSGNSFPSAEKIQTTGTRRSCSITNKIVTPTLKEYVYPKHIGYKIFSSNAICKTSFVR